jgi:hypothetical protein
MVKEKTHKTLWNLRIGSQRTLIQRDIGYVEKDFHLEIRSRRRENIDSCKWVSTE